MKHEPKPLIEEHFHIQELIAGQEKRTEDREYHRNRIKQSEERDAEIGDSKIMIVTDFWCDDCKQDFKAMAVRQIEEDWNAPQRIAYYKAKCDAGHWCIRLITDKQRDAFWNKSKLLAKDRANHKLDTLQPWEEGFVMLYGKK